MIAAPARTVPGRPRAKPLPDAARVTAARVRMVEQGLTAVAWAQANGENPDLVSKVLSGTRSCVRGHSRRIAIKLDIVDDVSGNPALVACNDDDRSQGSGEA